jgi:hypothetical protein
MGTVSSNIFDEEGAIYINVDNKMRITGDNKNLLGRKSPKSAWSEIASLFQQPISGVTS